LIQLFLITFWVFHAGCGDSPRPQPATTAQRIISLSPSATEIIYGVGAFDHVVAVSNYCTYPPGVERLPRVGGWNNMNLEQVVSLQPGLVIMADAQSTFVEDRLKAIGLNTLVIRGQSLNDALSAIEEVGRAVGREKEGKELAQQTRKALDEVRAQTRSMPKRRVLCIVDRVPGTLRDLYTAAEGSFLAQLVEIAGGESIAPKASANYGKITKEAVLALNPDVIIDMVQGAQGRMAENSALVWQELATVRAVREGRIYPIRDPSVLHPSQFVSDTARKFAAIIHPEVFGHDGQR
jgi:iron complex transport system substrate-binding protein